MHALGHDSVLSFEQDWLTPNPCCSGVQSSENQGAFGVRYYGYCGVEGQGSHSAVEQGCTGIGDGQQLKSCRYAVSNFPRYPCSKFLTVVIGLKLKYSS